MPGAVPDAVTYVQEGRIVTLTLNRPETHNALSGDVIEGLVAALERADADASVSVAILTGGGKSFSSGGNLEELRNMTARDNWSAEQIADWYRNGIQRIPRAMAAVNFVTIGAINGHAIGAGNDLATMCDLRVASTKAVFAESFLRVGLIPGDGGAWFLPRLIGSARAKEMLFTAKGIKAEQALEWGLVNQVVDPEDLMPTAQALAAEIAALPPVALRNAKRLIRDSATMSLDEALEEAAVTQGQMQLLADHHEAIDAIREKRKPSFMGR